jgi:hypothetical protein
MAGQARFRCEPVDFAGALADSFRVHANTLEPARIMKTPSVFRSSQTMLLSALGLALIADQAAAQSYFLQPGPAGTRDTWVTEADDFNHGGWGVLQANQDQFQQRILIQFDLSGIAGPVTSAYLGLYRFGAFNGEAMTLNAYPITADWNQSVTWSGMPASSATPAATTDVSGLTAGWVEWNITALVQAWMSGSQLNYGLAIYAPDGSDAGYQRFASSNNETAAQPDNYSFPRQTAFQPYLRGQLVPEPSTAAVLALGLAACCWSRARRTA